MCGVFGIHGHEEASMDAGGSERLSVFAYFLEEV